MANHPKGWDAKPQGLNGNTERQPKLPKGEFFYGDNLDKPLTKLTFNQF